ncbi:MAG: hypothetical protein P1U34_08175 [Coxiellaceae bacterium]|nr:hypothetical protein [Coxiellaceae bacterium]
MYPPHYDDEMRNNKQLLWLSCKLFVRALVTISPILPLMFVLGCIDAYLVREIDSYMWRVVVELVLGLIDGALWLTALCLLHTRFTGHKMPLMKAVHQALSRYSLILLLLVLYVVFAGVFYEISMLVRYIFHFFTAHYVNYILFGVLILIGFAYIYVNVLCFMTFLVLLLEKHSFFGAIKRSVALSECGWTKVFLAYIGFFCILLFVLLPEHFVYVQNLGIEKTIILQIVFALVFIPFWLTWYLLSFHDLKLCHEYDQAEEEVEEEEG